MRTPVIAGNWKLNKTVSEALELVRGIHFGLPWPGEVDVIVAPPFTVIRDIAAFLENSYIGVAAQDIFWEESGAFTGAVSGTLIRDAGAEYVIIGHSERRQYFGETDETVNKKIGAALGCQLAPIVCVGETLEERESDRAKETIEQQISFGLSGFTAQEVSEIIIAYEPVWAIGTGRTATPDEAEEVHSFIRDLLSQDFGPEAADRTRLLYGGSVKPENSRELLQLPNIDGALVGGASLNAADFIDIIKNA